MPGPVSRLPANQPLIHSAAISHPSERLSKEQALARLEQWAGEGEAGEDRAGARCAVEQAVNDNLSSLNLSNFGLRSLPPCLDVLTPDIHQLKLGYNALTDIKELPDFRELKTLELYVNDLQTLEGMPALENLTLLHLADNELTSLNGMPALHNLSRLIISENKLQDLQGMPSGASLETLELNGNSQLSSLGAMPDCLPALTLLDLAGCNISRLHTLPRMPLLQTLDLARNRISELTPLARLPDLTVLRVADNNISAITGLQDLNKLTELDISGNPLRQNGLRGLPSQLRKLSANTCGLPDLDGTEHMTSLIHLEANSNYLISLHELGQLPHLQELYANNNFISDISDLQARQNPMRSCELAGNYLPAFGEARRPDPEDQPLVMAYLNNVLEHMLANYSAARQESRSGGEFEYRCQQISAYFNAELDRYFADLPDPVLSHLQTELMDCLGDAMAEGQSALNTAQRVQIRDIFRSVYNGLHNITLSGLARERWSTVDGPRLTNDQIGEHINSVIPFALRDRLADIESGDALLLLCAGQLFTAAAPEGSRMEQINARFAQNMRYLEQNEEDQSLLQKVVTRAERAVNTCGDAVTVGETQIHTELEAHRILTGRMPEAEVWQRLEAGFSQHFLEQKGAEIAALRGKPNESLEYYLNLAIRVKEQESQLPLNELATEGLHTELFRVTSGEVSEALQGLDNKQQSGIWQHWLVEHSPVGQMLSQIFPASYEEMKTHRETLSDAAYDLTENNKKPANPEAFRQAYHYAFGEAPPETDAISVASARQILARTGAMENAWQHANIAKVLAEPALLYRRPA